MESSRHSYNLRSCDNERIANILLELHNPYSYQSMSRLNLKRIIRQGVKDFQNVKCPKKVFWTTLENARQGMYTNETIHWMRTIPCISKILDNPFYLPPQMRHSYNLRSCC
jgi:hypothetical protein